MSRGELTEPPTGCHPGEATTSIGSPTQRDSIALSRALQNDMYEKVWVIKTLPQRVLIQTLGRVLKKVTERLEHYV